MVYREYSHQANRTLATLDHNHHYCHTTATRVCINKTTLAALVVPVICCVTPMYLYSSSLVLLSPLYYRHLNRISALFSTARGDNILRRTLSPISQETNYNKREDRQTTTTLALPLLLCTHAVVKG